MGCTGGNQISEQEYQKMVGEINTYKSETNIKHNFLDKEFKSIEEIVKTLKECQVKDHHSKIYSLFLLFCWIAKNINFDEKSESNQECETVESILSDKKTNSCGLATLFKNLGENFGFNIEIVEGFTKHFGFELYEFPKTFQINHSYNAVIFGKNILFCDICLAIILHEYQQTYNPFFFCLPFEIMIEFNFPFDTKFQEEDKIITFDSFRNRLRLYPLYFKLDIENIELNYGNGLENINSDQSDTVLKITFKNEVNKEISALFYQKADIFRMSKSTTSHHFREKSIIYNYSEKNPGLFKFEVLSSINGAIADGIIKNAFPYKLQKEITNGKRDFKPDELSNYPVCVIPYRFGELIEDMIPYSSLVTNDKFISYKIILKEPPDNISASVKRGNIEANVILPPDYFKDNVYYMNILFSKYGFYDCTIWVNNEKQLFFNILYD